MPAPGRGEGEPVRREQSPSLRPGLPTTPPPDAILPQRHPDAPKPGEAIASHYRWCFGCGQDHPTGLHMEVIAGEGLTVSGEFLVTEHHQGAPGLAHGGLLAAAFDEALGALNWLLQVPSVTGRLETDFRKPIPVGSLLHIDAEITGQQGRKVYGRAVGRLGGPRGPVVLTSAALFVQVDIGHFTTHGRAEQVQRAAAARARLAPGSVFEVNP